MNELRGLLVTIPILCVIEGVLFGLHHFFVILPLFDGALALLGVLGTMATGGILSWMRLRGDSILDCYISHVLADLAVMWIGYDLIRNIL